MGERSRISVFDEAPALLFWEMTQACDLKCEHCRACAVPERSNDEFDTAEAFGLLDQAHALGTRLVVLTGGDPAKRDDLLEIVRYGARIGLRIAVTLSATPLITDALLLDLKEAGMARLALSLDGALPATHDRFRGFGGSHARTMEILSAAKRLGIPTQINTTVTRFNEHQLEAIGTSLVPYGIELWSVFFVLPVGRGHLPQVLNAEEAESVLLRLADLSPSLPFDIKTTAAPHFRRVLLQRKEELTKRTVGIVDGIGRVARGVTDGSGVLFVSHRGEVFPSGFLPVSCGNLREHSLEEIYRGSPLLAGLRNPDAYEGKCGKCEFRLVCGGSRARAYAQFGDPMAEDPGCNYVPKKLRSGIAA